MSPNRIQYPVQIESVHDACKQFHSCYLKPLIQPAFKNQLARFLDFQTCNHLVLQDPIRRESRHSSRMLHQKFQCFECCCVWMFHRKKEGAVEAENPVGKDVFHRLDHRPDSTRNLQIKLNVNYEIQNSNLHHYNDLPRFLRELMWRTGTKDTEQTQSRRSKLWTCSLFRYLDMGTIFLRQQLNSRVRISSHRSQPEYKDPLDSHSLRK